jgi:hypothetical protein
MSERVELRGIIASKQGLSCEGFYMLSNRTGHLRDRLYITVRDGDNLFLPKDPYEHFPCSEIEGFYVKRLKVGFFRSIGAGGGEIVFTLEGPSADEGAEAITAALPDVEAATNLPLAPRWVASIPEKRRYLQMTSPGSPRPYRPERIPERARVPQPFTEAHAKKYDPDRLKVSLSLFEEKKREALARWGMLEDYDRMQAEREARLAKSAPPSTSSLLDLAQTPWKEPP